MKDNSGILKNRNLLVLWLGQVLSQAGTRMYGIALSWWILTTEQDHVGLKMGILLIMGALPSLLFVKQIGYLIDHKPLKPLLAFSDLFAAVVSLSLLIFVHTFGPNLSLIYVVGFLLALFQGVIDPGLNKAVPLVTTAEDQEKAVALIASTSSFSYFFGALLGAALMGLLGLEGAVWANLISYILALLCTCFVQFEKDQTPSVSLTEPVTLPTTSVLEGNPLLKNLLIGFGLVNFFSAPTLVILPIYIERILKGDATTLAVAEAGLWFGMLLGAFIAPYFDRPEKALRYGALGIFGMGLFIAATSLSMPLFVYVAMISLATASVGFANVKFINFFQTAVETSKKGEFFALLAAFASFTFPVAFFLFGFLSDSVPIEILCLVQGVGVVLLSAHFFRCSRNETQEAHQWT